MEVVFDSSGRPLCRFIVGQTPSADSLEAALHEVEDELGRHRSMCLIADGSVTARIDILSVKHIANFGVRNHQVLQAYVRALAVVAPSAMARGAVKLAFHIKAPPHPYRVVNTLEEAEAYLAPYLQMLH